MSHPERMPLHACAHILILPNAQVLLNKNNLSEGSYRKITLLLVICDGAHIMNSLPVTIEEGFVSVNPAHFQFPLNIFKMAMNQAREGLLWELTHSLCLVMHKAYI